MSIVHTCMSVQVTHKFLWLEAQQFRVVFIRWGGSEKKYMNLSSSAYLFLTLWTNALDGSCNFKKRLFTEAPSNVAASTCGKSYTRNTFFCHVKAMPITPIQIIAACSWLGSAVVTPVSYHL